MNDISSIIENKFREIYQTDPVIIRSPGRVNLIGEHTDYNEGFVLPAAIDRAVYFAISSRDDDTGSFYAMDLDQKYDIPITNLKKSSLGWPNYLMGVIDQILKRGENLRGFNCVFGGNIPIGAGLSSSAALEAGLAFGLNEIFQFNISRTDLVKIAQSAENEFVGVQCGIMDQLINIYGCENQVLRLDCRSLEYQYYPFDSERVKIVLCDSQVQRELSNSEYNLRRSQCELGVSILKQFHPEVKSLRDVSLKMLQEHEDEFDPVVYKRCHYVIEENTRVIESCTDLENNNFKEFGRKMFLSHQGLRDDYEVSCRELDILVEAARQHPGIIGARMMGAGFGGCTINLVWTEQLENFEQWMTKIYKDKLHKEALIYVTDIMRGSEILRERIMNL